MSLFSQGIFTHAHERTAEKTHKSSSQATTSDKDAKQLRLEKAKNKFPFAMKKLVDLPGHHDIIYDLAFCRGEAEPENVRVLAMKLITGGKQDVDKDAAKQLPSVMVTASSDSTAKVWNMKTLSKTPLAVLQHANYVYAARMCPKKIGVSKLLGLSGTTDAVDDVVTKFKDGVGESDQGRIVVTGGYDSVIRVWLLQEGKDLFADLKDQSGSSGGVLLRECPGHSGYVNAIAFEVIYLLNGLIDTQLRCRRMVRVCIVLTPKES